MATVRVFCFIVLIFSYGCAHTKLDGSFSIEGPEWGEMTFQPAVCHSGDREYFFGVDLKSKTDSMTVRILQDPVKGTFLKVVGARDGKPNEILFDQASCKVLEGNLKQTKWRVNEIRDMSGELDVDCSTPNGEMIRGKITFIHCH